MTQARRGPTAKNAGQEKQKIEKQKKQGRRIERFLFCNPRPGDTDTGGTNAEGSGEKDEE